MPQRLLVVATLAVALLAAVVPAQMVDIATDSARVFSAPPGQSLAPGRAADARSVVGGFLATRRVPASALDTLVVTGRDDTLSGRTHVRLAQEVDGLRVYGTYVKASFGPGGELDHLIENLITPPARGLSRALVGPERALRAALAAHHPDFRGALVEENGGGVVTAFDGGSYFHVDPTATRVAVALANGRLDEGYLVETWSEADNLLHHTVVDRTGRVVYSELRTNADSYNIFPDHPGNSAQTVTDGPGAGNAESPIGWLSAGAQGSQSIAGNNAHAYLDADANNAPDATGATITDGNFLAVANLAQDPSTTANKNVAVQNLFYFNNVLHDKLYRHGFTEAAGNFQENNFGLGGAGGDSVDAEGQDGSGTNNANFSTPSDGSNPRMQMYLWTQTTPRRDGDVDSDIIYHEYGHGLTWRMIGGMSGPMSGAIGEGMSDVVSILLNNDDTVGEYSTNDPFGVRTAPYTNYPRTYGDFTGQSVHTDGEIYAAAMWRVWENFQNDPMAPVPQDTLWDYIVDGMNFTPAGPAMEDMRDGILASAATSGNECLIWHGFADFGIGVGAKAQVKGGGPFGGGKVSVSESFELPAECGGGGGGGGGSCQLGQPGDPCSSDAECCSNSCKGRPGRQTCK